MPEHTPGPWSVEDDSVMAEVGAHICTVSTADDFPCLDTEARPAAEMECAANAVLIAAAPELLASLKRLSALYELIWLKMSDEEMQACRDAWAEADAAIAKAENRTDG